MRNLKIVLISTILVLAMFCTLTGCLSKGANADPALNDGQGEEYVYTLQIIGDTNTQETDKEDGEEDKYLNAGHIYIKKEFTQDSINLTSLREPEASYNPGYDFRGWYFTSDFNGVSVDRMTLDQFLDLFDEYGFIEGDDSTIKKVILHAKWVSKEAKKIESAEDLASIYDIYLEEIASVLRANEGMSYEEARLKVNRELVFVLNNAIDLSSFDHYKFADEHVLDPDDYDDEAEMQEEADNLKVLYEHSWVPIAGGVGEAFGATFDGNGYEISGMEIIVTAHDQDPEFNYLPVGLFGKVTGTVKNVNLVDYKIQMDGDASRFYVGGIVGWSSFEEIETDAGTIRQAGDTIGCSSTGNIVNLEIEYTGNMWDSLFGSYAEPTSQVYYGGVIGFLEEADAQNISSNGNITSQSNAEEVYLGGAVGYNQKGRITSANANVYVYGRYAGGLVGYNNGELTLSYALGDAEGSLSYPAIAGGLTAYNFTEGVITRCYAEGEVRARTAGGLVGVNVFDYVTAAGGTIAHTYAKGNVFASEYAGGLVGRATADLPIFGREDFHSSIFDDDNEYNSTSSTPEYAIIQNCFAFGDVEANASETVFKDDEGKEVEASVYYSVFAGALFGQAYEQLVKGCIAIGDVSAISVRQNDTTSTNNTAFAGNFAGHTTNEIVGADYRQVYALSTMSVYRNGMLFDGENYPNTAPTQNYDWFNNSSNYNVNNIGFNSAFWNLSNLDFENGIYPTLKGV